MVAKISFGIAGFFGLCTFVVWMGWVGDEFHYHAFSIRPIDALEEWSRTGDTEIIEIWMRAQDVCFMFIFAVAFLVLGFLAWCIAKPLAGEAHFERIAHTSCGFTSCVSVSPSRASVSLSREYSEDRDLDEVARELALRGLETFPKSRSFYVEVKDSKGEGRALVDRHGAVT